MNKKLLAGITLTILLAVGIYGFSKLPSSNAENSSANSITFDSVVSKVENKNAVLYDVRTPDEYSSGHFKSALNFPLQSIQSGQFPNVDKSSPIYVYCHSGNRSSQATVLLKNAGYTNIIDLHGLTDVEKIGGILISE